MGLSIVLLFFLPWLDRTDNNPVKSTRYRSIWHKLLLASFVVALFVLGWLGTQPVTDLNQILGQTFTIVYFGFFLGIYLVSRFEKTKPVPERVTH